MSPAVPRGTRRTEPAAPAGGGATVVAPGPLERALVWMGFPLVGAGAGWLLGWLAGWASSLPWVPFQGPLELLASVPDPQARIGSLALGLLGGLVVAVLAERDYVKVTVADDQVTIVVREEGKRQLWRRTRRQAESRTTSRRHDGAAPPQVEVGHGPVGLAHGQLQVGAGHPADRDAASDSQPADAATLRVAYHASAEAPHPAGPPATSGPADRRSSVPPSDTMRFVRITPWLQNRPWRPGGR